MERKVLKRSELFDLVWQKPLRTLAKELGISDVGLAKICKRHNIPTPPQGHWTLVHMGKRVSRGTLPAVVDGIDEAIEITSTVSLVPRSARDAIQKLKAKRAADKLETVSQPIEQVVPAAAPPSAMLTLKQIHPSVLSTAAALRKDRADRDGVLYARDEGMCGVATTPEHAERLITFLDGLVRRLEERQIAFSPGGRSMTAARGQDSATFSLKPALRTQKYIPTEAEAAAEQRRLAKIARARGSMLDWDVYQPTYPETHRVQTGQYALAIEGWSSGVRKTWSDGKTQRLGGLLDDIGLGIDAYLLAEKARREEREERERRWALDQRRKALAAQRQRREEERIEFVGKLLDQHDETDRLQAWLSSVAPPDALAPAYGRMVAWARERIDLLTARSQVEGIEQQLARTTLFPEDDDLAESVQT